MYIYIIICIYICNMYMFSVYHIVSSKCPFVNHCSTSFCMFTPGSSQISTSPIYLPSLSHIFSMTSSV